MIRLLVKRSLAATYIHLKKYNNLISEFQNYDLFLYINKIFELLVLLYLWACKIREFNSAFVDPFFINFLIINNLIIFINIFF